MANKNAAGVATRFRDCTLSCYRASARRQFATAAHHMRAIMNNQISRAKRTGAPNHSISFRAPRTRLCVELTWSTARRFHRSRQPASRSSRRRFHLRRREIQRSLRPRILLEARNQTLCLHRFMNRVNRRRLKVYLGKPQTRFPVAGPTIRLRAIPR